VIELIVAFALCLSSLVLAALLWQWLATRSEGGREVLRLLGAVRRAGSDFLWQEGRLLGLSLVVVLAALAGPGVVWRSSGISVAHVAWSAAGLALGAGATALMAYVALRTGIGITARVIEALRLGSSDAVAATLRGSALVAVWTDAASVLLGVGLLALPGWHLGSQSGEATVLGPAWVAIAVRLLPAAALGAVAAAAVFQLGGVNFNTAVGVASLAARKQDPSLLADRDRDPALVAELVGGYVGAVAARVTDYFAALVLANSAMLLVCIWVHAQNAAGAAPGIVALGIVALPIVVRATGLVGSTITLSSMRFERGESTWRTFSVAELSAALIACVGLFGASLWLLGESLFLRYFVAGVLGVSANALAAAITHYRLRKNVGSGAFSAPAGSRSDARAARALGQGLQQTWALILGFGVCILLAWLLGSGSALQAGGPLGLVLVLSGVLSAGVFGLTRDLFSRLTEAVLTIAHASRSELDAPGRARAEELDRLGVDLGSLGRTQGILASTGAAGLTALSLATVGTGFTATAASPVTNAVAFPVALWGGALGAGMLLFYVGGALKTSSRTAAAVAEEIAQRLGDSSEAPATDVVRLPSYRVSVQLATQSATERLLPLTLITVLMPLALAFALRIAYGPEGQVVTAHGLAAFAAIATLTGSCTAFAAEGAEALLAYARRHGSAQPNPEASAPGAEFIGRSVGPAALLGLKATVVAALVSGPLLFGN
jgi:K(+)-stimulated pyrophosphate-energized sodium pump